MIILASYTMPLRAIIEHYTQDNYTMSNKDRIELGRTRLFDFEYPSFPEPVKKDFETNFIRHFYTREIGFETEGLFKFKLETWLDINMPYWVEMLRTEGMIKNPLINVDWTVTKSGKRDSIGNTEAQENQNVNETNTSNTKGNTFDRNITSDTPDSRLQITTGHNGTGVIEYASSIIENRNDGESIQNDNRLGQNTSTSKADSEVKDTFEENERTVGTMGMKTEAEMLQLYRNILIRIQDSIFKEMNKELFMQVY